MAEGTKDVSQAQYRTDMKPQDTVLVVNSETKEVQQVQVDIFNRPLEFNSVSEMKAMGEANLAVLVSGMVKAVQLNGYYQADDTPAPILYFISKTSAPEDYGSVFEVGGVKLEHQFTGEVDATYFGLHNANADNLQERISAIASLGCAIVVSKDIDLLTLDIEIIPPVFFKFSGGRIYNGTLDCLALMNTYFEVDSFTKDEDYDSAFNILKILSEHNRFNIELIKNKVYKLYKKLTIYSDMVSLNCRGAVLSFEDTDDADGVCIDIKCIGGLSETAPEEFGSYEIAVNQISQGIITSSQSRAFTAIRIDANDFKSIMSFSMRNLVVKNFDKGLLFKASNWCINTYDTNIYNCNRCLQFDDEPSGTGERINFTNCTFFNSDYAVYNTSKLSDIYFNSCSLDYCKQLIYMNGKMMSLYGCHLESKGYSGASGYFIQVAGESLLNIRDTEIYRRTTDNIPINAIINNTFNTVVNMDGVMFYTIDHYNNSKYIADSNGIIKSTNSKVMYTSLGTLCHLSPSTNLLNNNSGYFYPINRIHLDGGKQPENTLNGNNINISTNSSAENILSKWTASINIRKVSTNVVDRSVAIFGVRVERMQSVKFTFNIKSSHTGAKYRIHQANYYSGYKNEEFIDLNNSRTSAFSDIVAGSSFNEINYYQKVRGGYDLILIEIDLTNSPQNANVYLTDCIITQF